MGATQLGQPVESLDYPDQFHYQAAEGWLELGNLDEAVKELDQIASGKRANADVLHLRWRILIAAQRIERCLVVARALAEGFPFDARSWITLAETHYLMGDVQQAFQIASVNAANFPESWNLLYDAACYACLLGRFNDAQFYFDLATRIGDAKSIRRRALDDPDLEALWSQLTPRPRKKTVK